MSLQTLPPWLRWLLLPIVSVPLTAGADLDPAAGGVAAGADGLGDSAGARRRRAQDAADHLSDGSVGAGVHDRRLGTARDPGDGGRRLADLPRHRAVHHPSQRCARLGDRPQSHPARHHRCLGDIGRCRLCDGGDGGSLRGRCPARCLHAVYPRAVRRFRRRPARAFPAGGGGGGRHPDRLVPHDRSACLCRDPGPRRSRCGGRPADPGARGGAAAADDRGGRAQRHRPHDHPAAAMAAGGQLCRPRLERGARLHPGWC